MDIFMDVDLYLFDLKFKSIDCRIHLGFKASFSPDEILTSGKRGDDGLNACDSGFHSQILKGNGAADNACLPIIL